ncbi:aminotransferase class V-fold PLP-dependent enzyme [Amnibacterium sp. CER49]|uniref:aminotransferase class V-fold PLP-dependent enzyme n=1 Tax=Amnibacterium sp. CER49 TaxID=3039161 RepID=UPI002447E990|nr:aminotransferase class V-fold PLP-dependent enzyme [Amnibacterium sp. CER49]MDH2444741.1 aminotransferase class V-fold PLP-dependent enzyme [Amnibacterium sp. CER49]
MPASVAALDVPLLPVVGAGMPVPLVGGGSVRGVDLDLAATAPALSAVAAHVAAVLPHLGSVHRGAGWRSELATGAVESARRTIGAFVGARPDDAVVLTRSTTEALNLLAGAVPGSTVVLDVEHHANLLPWARSAGGAVVVRSAETFAGTLAALELALTAERPALLAVTGASNVTGEVLPLPELVALARRAGARVAVDGAQLVPHRRIDLGATGVDYLAFSGHKAYAPYGAGALVGRADWLDAAAPHLAGGGAVQRVRLVGAQAIADWRDGAARHEAGTPDTVGAVAIARAFDELAALDPDVWSAHEAGLRDRLVDGLAAVPGVRVLRLFADLDDAVGVVSFTLDGLDARLAALALAAEHGIGVRDGGFCAHPALERLTGGRPALRASLGVGTTLADVDALLAAVSVLAADGPRGRYERGADGWRVVGDDRPRPEWAVPAVSRACGAGS